MDYDTQHNIGEDHKALSEIEEPKAPWIARIKDMLTFGKKSDVAAVGTVA